MLICHLLMGRWEDSFQELILFFHHRFQGSATGHQTLTANTFYLLYLLASPLLGFCIKSAMKSNRWVFACMYISTLHVCRACRSEKKALSFDIFSQHPGNCSAPRCPWFSTPLDLGFFTLDQVDISGTAMEPFLQAFSPLLVCNTLLLVE